MANLATINGNLLADSGIDDLSVVVGAGTQNYIPKYSANGRNIQNSLLIDSGSALSYAGNIVLNAANYGNYALPLSGGWMTGKIFAPSFGSDVYGGAFEIRERGLVGNTQFDWSYSPAITFHWGNIFAVRLGFRSDGQLAVDNVPFLNANNYGSYALPLSGGAVTGFTSFTSSGDSQIALSGGSSTWAGITWSDVNGTDYMWFFGATGAWSLGGAGSSSGTKKLHVHGGVTIGSGYVNASAPANGLIVEGGSIFRGRVYSQSAQSDGNYTTAALWVESYDNTTTGIAFHISGVVGKFLEMRTDQNLYWNGARVMDSSSSPYAWNMNQNVRTDSSPTFATLYTSGQHYINNSDPTIYFQDTDHRSAMVHVNSNVFYVLRGSGTNSTSWAQVNGYWPLELNLENNAATFGGSIFSPSTITSSMSTGTVRTSDGGASGMLHIRPNLGQAGYITFTENAYDDKWAIGVSASDNTFYFRQRYPTGSVLASINHGGTIFAAGDVRAPIFYDSNDTSRYLDPNGTSQLGDVYAYSYQGNGNVGGTGAASWHPSGIYTPTTMWQYGAMYKNYSAIHDLQDTYNHGWYRNHGNTGLYSQSYNNHFYATTGSTWNIASSATTAVLAFRTEGHQGALRGHVYADNGNNIGFLNEVGNWSLRTWNGGVEAYGSMRAPIYYDSADTGFYVDPNSTSVLWYLTLNAPESLGLYGARGKFTNEYIHLYNKVGIGSPLGWGTGEANTPNFGLSTYGGANIAWGNSAGMSVSGPSLFYGHMVQGTNLAYPNVKWGAQSATGPVVIKLPGGSGNYGMVHMVIDIYEYNSNNVCTVVIGGHNWNSYWVNFGANVVGYTNKPVRLGFKDGQYCVVIGDSSSSWSYGQVILRKINNGEYYSASMNLAGSYTIGIESDSYSWISGDLRGLRVPVNLSVENAVYAPIYYDSNDANYYGDFASTSQMNSVGVNSIFPRSLGSGYYFTAGDWGWKHQTPSGHIQFGPANAGHAHIYTDRPNFYFNADLLVNGSTVLHTGNYSSYALPVSGGTLSNSVDQILTINKTGGSYWNYIGFNYAGSRRGYFGLDGSGHPVIGSDTGSIVLIGSVSITASVYSPIYYDSQDSGYYADFNSTSNTAIRVRGGMLMGPNPTWGAYLQVGGNGRENSAYATVTTTNGNLHLDSANGYNLYLNYYSGGLIYVGTNTAYYITGSGDYYTGTSASSNALNGWAFTSYIYKSGGTGYYQADNWIQMNANAGIYWPGYYGLHLYPNDSGSYGALRVSGSKNGWAGIWFGDSGNTLMMNSSESGHYMNGYGWQFRWYQGTLYNSRSTYGGGTEFTVLDSGNFTSWAPSLTGGGAYGTWGINVTGYSVYLPTAYAGGVQNNPQVYFNNGVGLKVAMTGNWSVWSDTVWVNGYNGSDVPNMVAMHFLRNGQPRMALSTQTSTSTSYGTKYEVLSEWNYTSYAIARSGDSLSGIFYFTTNNGGYCGSLSNASLQVHSTGGNSAYMSFHRGGSYAVNMGLDADNVLRIGGWSAAANRLQLDMSGNLTVAAGMYPSNQSTYYLYQANSGLWTNGNFGASSDIYLGTRAVWLSSWLDQSVRTDAAPTFSNIYNNGWFRNNNANEGLYNQSTTMHWSSKDNGFWDASSTNTVSSIRFWTGGHISSLRGYLYFNSSNEMGFLNGAGSWVLRMDGSNNSFFSGSVNAPSFYESSDSRLKTIIKDDYIADGIQDVKAKLYFKNGKTEIGYYAQDVQAILPSAVTLNEDGMLNLSYREVHTAKIAYLEKKIIELENKINKYENN